MHDTKSRWTWLDLLEWASKGLAAFTSFFQGSSTLKPDEPEIKRLFGAFGRGGRAVDRDRKRIYFCDEKRIIETDFDLNILRQVLEAPAGKRIEITGVENGEVRYRIY